MPVVSSNVDTFFIRCNYSICCIYLGNNHRGMQAEERLQRFFKEVNIVGINVKYILLKNLESK